MQAANPILGSWNGNCYGAPPFESISAQDILPALQECIDAAIAEIQRLPGAAGAQSWIGAARRYTAAQRALDLIETAALFEPVRLRDGMGQTVDQPSPIAAPPQVVAPAA